MKKLLNSKRFRITIIAGLVITVLTVIIILTITGEKENVVLSANKNTQTSEVTVEEYSENDEAISMLDESNVFETEIKATAVNDSNIEPEQIDEVKETDEEEPTEKPTQDASQDENQDIEENEENDTTITPDVNPDEEQVEDGSGRVLDDPDETAMYKDPDHEEDDPPQAVGAKMVDGVAVPMTNAEVDEFLRKIYATQSLEEYIALLDTIVYLNTPIDSTRLVWHESYQE